MMATRVPRVDHAVPLDSPLDRSWVARPAALSRYSRLLGMAWGDGLYLTAWPRAAQFLFLVALLVGLGAGATHWTPSAFGVISEPGIVFAAPGAPTYVTIFAQSLPFLVVVAFVGALSARAGLLLTLGYALGDYLIAGPQFGVPASGYPVAIFGFSNPYLTAFCYVRVPQLLMYALLFLLAVMPTLATASLMSSLRPLRRYLGSARRVARRYVEVNVRVAGGVPMGRVGAAILAVGRIVLLCAVQWWLVYAWTLAASMIFRIPWLWAAQPPPIPVFIFLAVIGTWVTNAAIFGMLLRGVLVLLANRRPAVRARAGHLFLAQAEALRRRTPSRLPAWASSALGSVALAVVITLLLSGYDSDPIVGIRIFGFVAAVLVLRSPLLPLLPPWRLWMGVANRIPAIVRLAGCAVALPALSMWYFLYAPGASVQANAATGSFGAQIVAIGLGLVLLVVLLPGAQRGGVGGPEQEVRAGGRARGRRVPERRIAAFGVSLMLLTILLDRPTRAEAACLDPHCCFNVDNSLAALVVGATVIALVGMAVVFAPEIAMAVLPEVSGDIGFDGLVTAAAPDVASLAEGGILPEAAGTLDTTVADEGMADASIADISTTADVNATDASVTPGADGGGGAGTGGVPDAALGPDDGPGSWGPADESMSDRAAQFQSQVTDSPPGQVYRLNDVKFDGYRDGTLLEAKGPGYARFVQSTGRFYPWFRGQSSLIDQASRQLLAARGTPIVWHVAEESAAVAIRRLLTQNGLGAIKVIFTAATL